MLSLQINYQTISECRNKFLSPKVMSFIWVFNVIKDLEVVLIDKILLAKVTLASLFMVSIITRQKE